MRGEVTLSTTSGPIQVRATLTRHLAVHRGHSSDDEWTLTHRPSGLAMAWFDTKREGVAAAEMLEDRYAADLNAIATFKLGQTIKKSSKFTAAGKRLRAALRAHRTDALA